MTNLEIIGLLLIEEVDLGQVIKGILVNFLKIIRQIKKMIMIINIEKILQMKNKSDWLKIIKI